MNLLLRKGGEIVTACFSRKKITEHRGEVKEKAKGPPMNFSLFRVSLWPRELLKPGEFSLDFKGNNDIDSRSEQYD